MSLYDVSSDRLGDAVKEVQSRLEYALMHELAEHIGMLAADIRYVHLWEATEDKQKAIRKLKTIEQLADIIAQL